MTASPQPDALEALVFECLERIESEGIGALEGVCKSHPEHERALRERIAMLRRAGLVSGSQADEAFPERLGDFRLIERLGTGGMGVVYLAEQISLGRQVALKLIRPEQLYFPNTRVRFQREIDAIARLQHPGIVPIHAVGAERGIPYYAMEYVRGASLSDVLGELSARKPTELSGRDLFDAVLARSPSIPDAGGELFVGNWADVCAKLARAIATAVEHAHQRGVLHRDIKPSNVMITPSGRVVLLDFGLASLMGTDRLTRTGSQLGSLPYMSPEQVRGELGAVGARTDVYAIGVTLYELLTLRPPYFDRESTEKVRGLILEGRIPPLRELHKSLSRELATVCTTAMAAEPARRYASAALLAADLDNVLALRPIAAQEPSTLARVRSWARRKPAHALAAGLAFALAVGGPLVFAWQQSRASERIGAINQNLEAALGEARKQSALKDQALNEAQSQSRLKDEALSEARQQSDLKEEQRAAAERNLKKAVEAVDTMLTRVGQDTLKDVPQMVGVRRKLLEDALRLYQELSAEKGGDPKLRESVHAARLRVGSMQMLMGDLSQADETFTLLVDEFRPLTEVGTPHPESLRLYAKALSSRMQIRMRLGAMGDARADVLAAIASTERIPVEQRRAQATAELSAQHDMLADLEQRLGHLDASEQAVLAAIEVSRAGLARHSDFVLLEVVLGRQLDRLGQLYRGMNRPKDALTPLREALQLLERYHARDPRDTNGRQKLAAANINMSNALKDAGQHSSARVHAKTALALDDALVSEFPDVPSYRVDLSYAHIQLFLLAMHANELAEAEAHMSAALEQQEYVAARKAFDPSLTADMASALDGLAVLKMRMRDPHASATACDRGLLLVERALQTAPKNKPWRAVQLGLHHNRGIACLQLGRWRDAAADARALEPGEDASLFVRRAQLLERSSRQAQKDESLAPSARASEADALRRDALADLKRAVELGHHDWSELADPDDWASLRDDPEFQGLVAAPTQTPR